MHRQSSIEANITHPNNSKSMLALKNSLTQQITLYGKQQNTSLNDLSQKCSIIEYSLGSIEVIVAKLSQRLRQQAEKRESEVLSNLKIKQYEFIINELKNTVLKHSKKQQKLIQQLDAQKKKEQQLRDQLYKLQGKYNSLEDKQKEMEIILADKNQELQQLTLANHKYKLELQAEDLLRSRYRVGQENDAKSKECYQQLETKLEQLEKDLQTQITILQVKNKELHSEIKKLQSINDEALVQSRNHKRQIDQLNKNKYELEIKLKQQVNMNQQLEENYNKLLEKSNYSEILLHKQIQQLKTKEVEIRNEFKKQKKNIKIMLSGIGQTINNGSKYYLASNSIKDQVEQIKKLHQKVIKKRIQQSSKEIQSYEIQMKKLKVKNEQMQQSLQELQHKERVGSGKRIQYLSERDFDKIQPDRVEKESEGTNSFVNKSIEKSEEDRYKNVEQKYKNKLQSLRKDLKNKQNRINELQKQLQIEFDSSKEKILQLEMLVSEKGNEIRKSQLKLKEKDYELQQLRNIIKQLETKNVFLAQRFESQKQASLKMFEMKAQNYQQKLKNIKAVNKELQKKQQQKTIKYNKLKSKYQKYEIEVTESLKRKNAQIDQMLKEKTRLKTDLKLLEEKNNLRMNTQTNSKSIQKDTISRNILQEVQYQKQRLREDITEKKKQIAELIQSNTKMSTELFVLKRQIKEYKATIEELSRETKNLREDNVNLKQKVQIITQKNNQQSEQKHSYFKKQLEKTLIQTKKQQKTIQKFMAQKQHLKKNIQQLHSQISNLNISTQKLKQKNTSLLFEFQNFKEEQKKKIAHYEIKLSQFATKQQQLVDIINYKNRQGSSIRESMKGDQPQIQIPTIIKFDKSITTQGLICLIQTQMNTSKIEQKMPEVMVEQQKHIIPSEILFDDQFDQQLQLQQKQAEVVNQNTKVAPQEVNYFNDLINENQSLDQHFDICEEGQEINIGQTAFNLQIKDVFNSLRKEIQKVFNQEDFSIKMMKELPKHLEDDFNEFMAYVKQKIYEIKHENNLSFIMVEQGSEVESIQEEIANFIKKQPTQYIKLCKIIEQKEVMISSLMNEMTEQQNTINQMTLQKEQMEEQNQNRFMNQCNVYKKQIKECKKQIDILQMNCQSLKNIFKNTLELWVDDNDNQDDIKDNIVLYINICRLNETDKRKLNQCLEKYRYSKMRK